MKAYGKFVVSGLILGLFMEVELKLVAGIQPTTFVITLFAYPVLVSLAFAGSWLLDQTVRSTWRGDVIHYIASGLGGLVIEWTLLGNGPGSNALQWGMFAMWTTFCFGPRVLIRQSEIMGTSVWRFWMAFAVAAVVLTTCILLSSNPQAKFVIAVLGLSISYLIWWLLRMGWRSRSMGTSPNEF
jgi:hypothetical protein